MSVGDTPASTKAPTLAATTSASRGFSRPRELKTQHDDLKDIPLLMVTAINANSPLGFSARDIDEDWLPISDFLEKPVELDALRNKVNEMLAPAGD